jgi:hypothetical protein
VSLFVALDWTKPDPYWSDRANHIYPYVVWLCRALWFAFFATAIGVTVLGRL